MFGFMNWFNKLLKLLGLDKGLLSVTGGNTIAAITGGIFWLFIATLMSSEEYGQLNYFLSIAFLLSSVSMLGLGNSVITFLPKGKEELLYQANLLVVFSNCILLVLLVIFLNNVTVIFLLVGISFFVMSQVEYLGRKDYKNYSYVTVAQRLLNVPLSLSLYFVMGIDGIILGYAISTLLFSYTFFKSFRGFTFRFSTIKTNLSFITHSYYLDLAGNATRHADKLLIASLFGFGVLGLYQIGFQFFLLLSIIPMSVFQFMLPQEASNVQQKKIAIRTLILVTGLSISLMLAIPTIITNLLPNFLDSVEVSQIMILSIIPMTVNSIMYSRFLGREKSKSVLISSSLRLFTLLILILFLGQILGLIGLGIAILVSYTLESVALLIISKYVLNN